MSQFPMKSKYGMVVLEQVGGRSPRRWKVSFINEKQPVLFGTIGRLTFVEHKNIKLRDKARHEIMRKWSKFLESPYHHASCDLAILQGDSIDIQTNLDAFEDAYYDRLLPLEHRVALFEKRRAKLDKQLVDLLWCADPNREWIEPDFSKDVCKVHADQLLSPPK
jgi:hypothetical protein